MRPGPWVWLSLALLACAEEERAPVAPRPGYNVTDTSGGPMREVLQREDLDPDELLRCDIRELDCQERVFEETSQARGSTGARPPVSVATESEFAQILADAGGGEPAPQDGLRLLALLHLISPELDIDAQDEATFDALLAVYFFESDEVVVIDHGKPLDTAEATLTLSHEYVHSLQDTEHDLTRLSDAAATTDQRQGLLGLVEGEAEVYAALTVTGELNENLAFWRRLRRVVLEAALESDAPFLFANLNFPYTYGTEFATFAWLGGGDPGIAGLYDVVPRSSRQILAGAAAEPPAGGWVEVIDDTAAATLAAGFELAFEDSLGAFTAHLFLEVLAHESGASSVRLPDDSFASDLRGDHALGFIRDGSMVAVWRMRFEPQVDPADVIAEIADHAPGAFELREQAGDVLVLAGEDAAALQEFADAFELPVRAESSL